MPAPASMLLTPAHRERVLARVLSHMEPEPTSGCWIWLGSRVVGGYGRVSQPRPHRMVLAHRAVYQLMRGPIPEGLTLEHTCGLPSCVNPDHLTPMTLRDNILSGRVCVSAVNARKTVCHLGHPFEIAASGRRWCRICARGDWRAYAKRARGHGRGR